MARDLHVSWDKVIILSSDTVRFGLNATKKALLVKTMRPVSGSTLYSFSHERANADRDDATCLKLSMRLSVTFWKNESKRRALLRLLRSDEFTINENEAGITNVGPCVISLKMKRVSFVATTNAADECEQRCEGKTCLSATHKHKASSPAGWFELTKAENLSLNRSCACGKSKRNGVAGLHLAFNADAPLRYSLLVE